MLRFRVRKILKKANSIVGMSFREIDSLNTFGSTAGNNQTNKGLFGNIIQENVFGIPANSSNQPDFVKEGLELKVTRIKQNRDGKWIMPERLVCNIINFMSENLTGNIFQSSFWKKNRYILIVMYEGTEANKMDNKIVGVKLIDLLKHPEFKQLSDDYSIINNHINNGNAHLISGSHTKYLEACTKGAGRGRDMRKQPKNTIYAKQRAYALKPALMSPIVHEHMTKNK